MKTKTDRRVYLEVQIQPSVSNKGWWWWYVALNGRGELFGQTPTEESARHHARLAAQSLKDQEK